MKALLIVDVQNDFCPGGSYPVKKGDRVIGPINKALAFARKSNWKLFASRDWHPVDVFKDKPASAHCIVGTKGAEYHPDLDVRDDVEIISKGKDVGEKHYSAFNGDDKSLLDLFRKNNIDEVYIAGLATDYCVKNTVLDSLKFGFKTCVIIDGCRGVNKTPGDDLGALEEMKEAGAFVVESSKVIEDYLGSNIKSL
ncbi:MAG: isochorismatase family protein [Candidatus Dojkabacteria bacterium]|nr:isochorismatase family protein [Candidatus Dojkabacteria bacterium]